MAGRETALSARIRLLASRLGARLFRNQVGLYTLADGRRLRSGLGTGSPDLVGWMPLKVTREMVGETVAVFVGLEVKADGSQPRPNQQDWLAAIRNAGGIGDVAWSEADAEGLLTIWFPGRFPRERPPARRASGHRSAGSRKRNP